MSAGAESGRHPDGSAIVVRFDRTAAAWMLVIGAAVLLAVLLYDLMSDHRVLAQHGGALSILAAYLFSILLAAAGVNRLVRVHYFTYRPDIETLTVSGGRTYPQPGYEWLARTRRGEVFECGPGGAIRRVPVSRRNADAQDWTAFVDALELLDADETPPEG